MSSERRHALKRLLDPIYLLVRELDRLVQSRDDGLIGHEFRQHGLSFGGILHLQPVEQLDLLLHPWRRRRPGVVLGVEDQKQGVPVDEAVVGGAITGQPYLLSGLVGDVVVSGRPEEWRIERIQHRIDLIPLGIQLGRLIAVAFNKVSDVDHELRLQQVDLLDRQLERLVHIRPAGSVANDYKLEGLGIVLELLGRPWPCLGEALGFVRERGRA